MGKVSRLFSSCFGRGQVDHAEVPYEDAAPILDKTHPRNSTIPRRPPRFPKNTRREDAAPLRPKSPSDKRLKRLGQKIEAEVRKEYCSSRQSQTGETASSEWNSSALLSTTDSLNSYASYQNSGGGGTCPRYDERSTAFPSLEVLEADCYRTLVEKENHTAAYNPVCMGTGSSWSCSSSAASLSPRDSTVCPYLFYEDDEDVVMEFLPTLPALQQVC